MREACLEQVYALAKIDPRITFIGSDLGVGTLRKFKDEMPDRFYMEGISEAHVVGMAAGLALDQPVGVYGRRVALDHLLADGDRVEIYRPLRVDPKEARRRRALRARR